MFSCISLTSQAACFLLPAYLLTPPDVCCRHQSYAPYTKCPAGVSLITKSGQVVSGNYLESAAHNPGVAPLQSAVVSGIIAGCLDTYDQV